MTRKDRWENPSGGRVFGMVIKCFVVLFATLHFGYLHYWPAHFDAYTGEIKPKIELMTVPADEDPTIWRCATEWDGYKPMGWGVCKDPNRTHERAVDERPFVHPNMLKFKDLWPVLLSFFAAALALWIYLRLNRKVESMLVWHDAEEQKFARVMYRIITFVDMFGVGYLLGYMTEDPDLTLYLMFIEMPDWLAVMLFWAAWTTLVYSSDFKFHRLNLMYANERRPSHPPRTTGPDAEPRRTGPTAPTPPAATTRQGGRPRA